MDASIRARNAADTGLRRFDSDRLLVHGASVVAFPAYDCGRRLPGRWFIAVVVALASHDRVGEVVFVDSPVDGERRFDFAFSMAGHRAHFSAETPLVPLAGFVGFRKPGATCGLVFLDHPMPDQVTWYAGGITSSADELACMRWAPGTLLRV
jgi:hypothetical protein